MIQLGCGMTELLLEHDEGIIRLGENTLVVALDDTGNEEFQDPNHRVFGLGGCAFMVRDYPRLIEQPRNYMCDRFFPDQERPMHASDISFTPEQMAALKHFFENFQFFRLATTVSDKTIITVANTLIDVVGASLLSRIAEVGKWAEFGRLFILFEASDRIEAKVLTSLSGRTVHRNNAQIEIELAVMPKAACAPALEVADFIIHTAGAQTRERNKGREDARADFEIIFCNVDARLTSFMEITKVQEPEEP